MIADRRSQIADRNKVCDRLRSYGNYFCDRLRSCDRDRRRSQKIEPCSISCDRLRSIAIVCDLRSAICDPRSYGNQPLDRTWFYLLRSSAITIAGSQTIADLFAICDHMETSLKLQQPGWLAGNPHNKIKTETTQVLMRSKTSNDSCTNPPLTGLNTL